MKKPIAVLAFCLLATPALLADALDPQTIYTVSFRGTVADGFGGLRLEGVNVNDSFSGQFNYAVGPFGATTPPLAHLNLTIGALSFDSVMGIEPGGESHDGDTLRLMAYAPSINAYIGLLFWGQSEALCPIGVFCDSDFGPHGIPWLYPYPTNLTGPWFTRHLEVRANPWEFNWWGTLYDGFNPPPITSSPYLDSPFSITSTSIAPSIPEPSTWLLLSSGILLASIEVAMRRRQRQIAHHRRL